MTDKLRQAAQQALAALDELYYSNSTPLAEKLYEESSAALRTALAEQPAEQEPVAHENSNGVVHAAGYPWSEKEVLRPLVYGDTATQPVIPPGYKLVPDVPTNEWINNLAKRQTGSIEEVPFVEIHQCIAELLEAAPEAPQPVKQPQEPSVGGVLFAVEEAIRNGDCPWQIEQAFDDYEAKRRSININGDA